MDHFLRTFRGLALHGAISCKKLKLKSITCPQFQDPIHTFQKPENMSQTWKSASIVLVLI